MQQTVIKELSKPLMILYDKFFRNLDLYKAHQKLTVINQYN